jgi:hypothetical protein
MDDELSDVEIDSDAKAQCDALRLAAGVGETAWVKRRSACLSKQVSGRAVGEVLQLLTVVAPRHGWYTPFCRSILA